jgi:hypothetical protein
MVILILATGQHAPASTDATTRVIGIGCENTKGVEKRRQTEWSLEALYLSRLSGRK